MTASYTRFNALDQQLDIAGSLIQNASAILADEPAGLGAETGNTGTASVTFAAPSAGSQTISGLTGGTFAATSQGNFLTISGAANATNNGTFYIIQYISATSVAVSNSSGVAEGPTASVVFTERAPYSLQDDLNFERTDRAAIKGTTFYAAIPTYQRPTAVGTNVPANLSNIASKTTDAVAYSVSRGQFGYPVEPALTWLYGTSVYKHADAVNEIGVPCFDAAPFLNDFNSCFVTVLDSTTGNELEVLAGPHAGERIFGVTTGSTTTSPNSVQISWYSCPLAQNIATASTVYSWEKGAATSNTGTTSVTATVGTNGQIAITGMTGAGFTSLNVGNWLTLSGFTNATNNGSFVIVSVQSTTAVTIQNHAGVTETHSATWTEYLKTVQTIVNLTYGYNQRLDQLDQNAFRFPAVSGLVSDADLRAQITDIESSLGIPPSTTNLNALLTNQTNYFPFSFLGTSTPSAVTALNTLNSQIGNLTYTGSYLTNGQTVTASLQALANAVNASTVTRYIERLSADVPVGTAHTLPGGATYAPDGTNNGKGLWVFVRGVLRDPGSSLTNDDYVETSTTSVTPISFKWKAQDHVSYFVL
jgi:hypothetical protein